LLDLINIEFTENTRIYFGDFPNVIIFKKRKKFPFAQYVNTCAE